DGNVIKKGTIASLQVAPHDSVLVDLHYSLPRMGYKEIFLNVYYKTKSAEGMLPADWEIAKDQLVLYSHLDNMHALPESDNLRVTVTDSSINAGNNKVQFAF